MNKEVFMGLFGFIKSQFIEVIEWSDSTPDTLVYKFPVENKEIKMGAQLTVRESQVAIFVNEGQIADVFEPGRYILETENMPILTKLKSWKYGFNSPFKAEVYFVSTQLMTDQKWGTSNPVMMRDQDFGMIRLRAFGIFAYRVKDPVIFLKDVFGTQNSFKSNQISGQLKGKIVSMLSDILAESQIPALDFSVHYNELSLEGLRKLKDTFYSLGFELNNFVIENISLPEEVEAAMDKRTSMGVLGNLNQYAQYQAAEAMRDAANNPGNSTASTGVGLGAGVAMGQMFTQSFQQGSQPQSSPKISCPHCQKEIEKDSKFCPACGQSVQIEKVPCSKCGELNNPSNKFCADCGQSMAADLCKSCGNQLKAGAKFCPECGESV
jgi:membrane protease subunit (stomatin/prohibitin family)